METKKPSVNGKKLEKKPKPEVQQDNSDLNDLMFAIVASLLILYRNFFVFGHDCYKSMYTTKIYFFLPSFFRIYGNAATFRKEKKSLIRNIFWNLIRTLHVQVFRNLLYRGSIDWIAFRDIAIFTVVLTCVL